MTAEVPMKNKLTITNRFGPIITENPFSRPPYIPDRFSPRIPENPSSPSPPIYLTDSAPDSHLKVGIARSKII